VDEKELQNLQWWHDHHKSNVIYLVRSLERYFGGDEKTLSILESALKGYSLQYPEVKKSETEVETTE